MYKKSKVITPDDDMVIMKPDGTIAMTLGKVIAHKYLGINTYGTIFKTRSNWEKKEQLKLQIHICGHVINCQKKDLTL